jgi:hypothetical protein
MTTEQRCEHLREEDTGVGVVTVAGIAARVCAECDAELHNRLDEVRKPPTPIEIYAESREMNMGEPQRCQLTKNKLVPQKNGKKVKQEVFVCGLAAQDGSAFCPRHTFDHNIKTAEAQKVLDIETAKKAAGVNVTLPSTRRGMEHGSYKFCESGPCPACLREVEWWVTPKGRKAAFDPMPHDVSGCKSHYETCPNVAQFRGSN